MLTQAPLRLARLAFLLSLAALAASALVVFPLQWLSLKAEASASRVASGYASRAGEPTPDTVRGAPVPQPEFSPAPEDDGQIVRKAGRQTTRTLAPVLVFVGLALVCFFVEIALGPRNG
jgi:hypothetical protein